MRKAKTAICKPAAVTALVAALFLVAALLPAAAQTSPSVKDYALIFGTVWDTKNQPAYGVPVKIRRANEKRARWELLSDHQGEFAQRVPTGAQDYVVLAEIKNGKRKAKAERKIHIENNERVDISLHLTE